MEHRRMNIAWVDILDENKLARKHDVRAFEVEEILLNNPRLFFVEQGNIKGEDVYLALGRTEEGRYLSVFFTVAPANPIGLRWLPARAIWTVRSVNAMAKNKKTRDSLPKTFETVDEFAAFWDSHSTADYPEAFREVRGTVKVQRRRYYRVALASRLGAQLARRARTQGVTLDTLVNQILKANIHPRV
jgi:uncharacterized DUF497 family protein